MAFDITDKTGNRNNLTNGGTVVEYTTSTPFAASEGAVDVPGNYLYIDDANQTGLDLASNFTLELWVNFDTLPASGEFYYFIAKWDTTGNQRGYAFGLENSGGTRRLSLLISNDGISDAGGSTANWTPSTGTWYHVAVRYNTTGATNLQFYVDGATQGPDQDVADWTPFNNTAQFFIGTRTGYTPQIDAKIDEVRVWNVARTTTQIANNIMIMLTGTEANLVAYYPFEDIQKDSGGVFLLQ